MAKLNRAYGLKAAVQLSEVELKKPLQVSDKSYTPRRYVDGMEMVPPKADPIERKFARNEFGDVKVVVLVDDSSEERAAAMEKSKEMRDGVILTVGLYECGHIPDCVIEQVLKILNIMASKKEDRVTIFASSPQESTLPSVIASSVALTSSA